ncbi:MAG: GPI inositol deacylase [Candelina submexicana]|nr:MAG: GPI inositol deacylase [Candelina submexicana]
MRRRPSGSAAEDDDDDDDTSPGEAVRAAFTDRPDPGDSPSSRTSARASASIERKQSDVSHVASGTASPSTWGSSQFTDGSTEKAGARDMIPLASHPSTGRMTSQPTTLTSLLLLGFTIHSFITRQLDPKGCIMSYMDPLYAKFVDFDTEHTRFASKYSLYLYREKGVKGVPVLFIPGNAGSFKQVRPLGAEAAQYFRDSIQHDLEALKRGIRSIDFFTVDFNEDLTAFHGQTMLDQAEYLNEAVAYILSLYHDPRRSARDPDLPDPSSVILIGHSMGGIVARTMLTMPNYQSNSINTIITMSAPHARAPVSFDADMVRTYKQINDYWRNAYSQKWANDNPLWHVTLISIAGGGLDTVVPSDYSSIASLVPDTHGFTVFTSSMPNVWTGMDHLSILWCDQFRKVIVRAVIEAIDANRPNQTKPRAERMRIFKKQFLTGMESFAEKALPGKEPITLLTLEDNSNSIISQGQRLSLRGLGRSQKPRPYLLPIPPQGTPGGKKLTLLSNQNFDASGEYRMLEVLFCSVFPLQAGQSAALFSMNIDLSANTSGSTRLACKNAATDAISLPASTRTSRYSFDQSSPFTYLQYQIEDLADHQFVAIVDKAVEPSLDWVVAEFSDNADSLIQTNVGLLGLLTYGVRVTLPANRPMMTELKIPALRSSLFAYRFSIGKQACGDELELFTPLLRQYLSEPYESKYFVNVKEANISLHGIAPFMPPPLRSQTSSDGVSLQLWSDPTCNTSIIVTLELDFRGSLGKLVMRYRTIFAAFPLLVVALVLRKQFQIHDETGVFRSFSESMGLCLRTSLPVFLLALSCFALSLARSSAVSPKPASSGLLGWHRNATEPAINYERNDLLLGSQDPFFWFLVPLFGLVSVGVCVLVNYGALGIIHVLSAICSLFPFRPSWIRYDERRSATTPAFAASSPRRRTITTGILLILVALFIPYQFAYIVACVVQIVTCIRALSFAGETRSGAHLNFYNYAHSILVLMLWILPINIPTLVVWVHNLAVQWLTPFSSHHNVLSIMPLILLVETLTSGTMIPRVTTRMRYITNLLFVLLAVYAAVYGVTYAYLLHHLVNIVAAWLVALHLSNSTISLSGLGQLLDYQDEEYDPKKRP